ncbi:MAG: hypothetical protein II369_02485 [Clostridia bacterium]|nr:hypothetical protein [Clostridia bacterium]
MGNGLYQLLTAARLSRTSDMPLWEELWQFWQDKYFTLDLSKYENLGLGGGGHMFSLPQMIAMMLIGVIIASFATIFNKRVLGDFVRVMLQYEATSVEKAKTLEEFGYLRNSTIRQALRRNASLRRVVHCVEEEEFAREVAAQRASYEERRAADGSLPPFIEPTYKMDVNTAHYYIAEKDKYMADVKFEKRGTNWFTFAIVVICCVALFAFALFILPDVFQYMDNFIGMFRSAGRNGNILQ